MRDIFMNFGSVNRLSGVAGEIRSSIEGCSQELRSIGCGLNLGRAGEQIRSSLNNMSNQCNAHAQRVQRMGNTMRSASEIMQRAENRVIEKNMLSIIPRECRGSYISGFLNNFSPAAILAASGMIPGRGYAGDPISMYSGNLLWQFTPISTYSGDILDFTLYYDSMNSKDSAVGKGWRHNFMTEVLHMDQNVWAVIDRSGVASFFAESDDGVFYPQRPSTQKLVRIEDGFMYYLQEEQIAYKFNAKGKLVAIYDKGVEVRSIEYDNDLPVKASGQHGYFYKLNYDDSGHIVLLEDNIGRTVKFEYDGTKLISLIICTEPDSKSAKAYDNRKYSFYYDDQEYLIKVTDPEDKTFFTNIYDKNGRVIRQELSKERYFEFVYEEGKTINTDQDGFKVEYIHDKRGNLIYLESALIKYTAEYDDNSNLTKSILNDSEITKYSYNHLGQIVMITNSDFVHNFIYDEDHRFKEYIFNGRSYLSLDYDHAGNNTAMHYLGDINHLFYYDEKNRLIGYEADGESCRISYNEQGFISAIDSPEDFSEYYTYDGIGRITNVKLSSGRDINYIYAFDDHISYLNDELGYDITLEYSLTGALNAYTEGEKRFEYSYDHMGNVTRSVLPGDEKHYFDYDKEGNLLTHYREDFLVEKNEYDIGGNVISVEDGWGYKEEYEWNIWQQVVAIKNSDGLDIKLEYDFNHFLSKVSMHDFKFEYRYDADGRLSSVTDEEGRYAIYEYDEADRLVQINTFLAEMEVSYDSYSNVNLITMADFGYLLQYGYDEYNRFNRGKLLGEPAYELSYTTGRIDKFEIGGEGVGFKYDSADRVVGLTNYLGKKVTQRFDRYDNLISMGMDELDDAIEYGYDLAGRISWVRDEEKRAIVFTYDKLDNNAGIYHLTKRAYEKEELNLAVEDWLVSESEAYYKIDIDYEKRLMYITDSLGETQIKELTSREYIKKITYENGDSKELNYDELNRITKISESGTYNEESEFIYENNNIIEANNSKNKLKLEYDLAGRVVGVHYDDGSVAGYEWNQANLCKAMIYPDGSKVEYAYDSYGNLIKTSLAQEEVNYKYDEKHRLIKKQSGKFRHSYSYHANGRVKNILVQDTDGALLELDYVYDDYYGLMTGQTIKERGKDTVSYDYEYDKKAFLTKVLKNDKPYAEYEYDARGNRTRAVEEGVVTEYFYNKENQLLKKTCQNREYTYEYNARGDLIKEYKDQKCVAEYTYNSIGQILFAKNEKGSVMYTYDALGNKTAADFKYADGKKVKETYYINYLISNSQSLCKKVEEEGTSKSQNQYFDGSPLAEEIDGKLIWDIFDEPGSLVMRLESGENYQRIDYSPFGSIIKTGASFGNFNTSYGFASMQSDGFIGRHSSGTRVYDPENARFQSKDIVIGYPYNPRSFNRYIYAQNDPKNKKDPDGFFPFVACLISGAVKAGVHLAKEAVVAGTVIVTKAAINAAQGNGFNVWEQTKAYAKTYRWDKLAVDTATNFVTGCLDPLTGGFATVAKKVVKYGSKLAKNALDCVHDKKPFFSWSNAAKFGKDVLGDVLEDVGIKKNIRDMAFNKIGNTLLNAGGFGKKLSKWVKDPIGRYLSKVMDPKDLRKYMGNIKKYINADGILSKVYKGLGSTKCIVGGVAGGGYGGSCQSGTW